MFLCRRSRIVFTFAILWVAVVAKAGSETPPPGAPWFGEFGKAHREALKTGKPIFVYFTKTY